MCVFLSRSEGEMRGIMLHVCLETIFLTYGISAEIGLITTCQLICGISIDVQLPVLLVSDIVNLDFVSKLMLVEYCIFLWLEYSS